MGKHCRGQRILININNEIIHFNVNSSNSRYLMHYEKIGYNINILNFEQNRCEIYRDHTFDSYWE